VAHLMSQYYMLIQAEVCVLCCKPVWMATRIACSSAGGHIQAAVMLVLARSWRVSG
jgi:hypothetical protein